MSGVFVCDRVTGHWWKCNTRPRRLVEVNVARHCNLSTQHFCTVHCLKSHGRTLADNCTIGVMVPGMHRRSRDTASGDHDSHEHARTARTRRGIARERMTRFAVSDSPSTAPAAAMPPLPPLPFPLEQCRVPYMRRLCGDRGTNPLTQIGALSTFEYL